MDGAGPSMRSAVTEVPASETAGTVERWAMLAGRCAVAESSCGELRAFVSAAMPVLLFIPNTRIVCTVSGRGRTLI